MFHDVWGHFITDFFRRAWFFKSEDFKQFRDYPIVCVSMTAKIEGSYRQMLEILGVDFERFQIIECPTKFKNIILPDDSYYVDDGKKFTTEYRETIDCVRNFALKNRTPTSCKKLYYFYGRKCTFGEERLAEYFESKGYKVVRPETLTLNEQLNLLINCESFATTIGSSSHNSFFLRDGTETILIPRAISRFGAQAGYQTLIDQVFPMNTNYIDSSLSVFYGGNHYYCYIISEQLKRFFGDKWDGYEEYDFKTFLQYVKISLDRGRVVNPRAKKDYAPILEDFMAQLKQREDLIAAYNMPPCWETFQPPLKGYQVHLAKKGWDAWQKEEQISGSLEDNLDIQAVKINFPNHNIHYSVYYNAKEGWSEEVSNGEQAGTTGKSKAIFGIKIRLDEAGTKEFDILYRVHKFDGEWTDWAKNGECIYSYGQKLNALQIKLEPKRT